MSHHLTLRFAILVALISLSPAFSDDRPPVAGEARGQAADQSALEASPTRQVSALVDGDIDGIRDLFVAVDAHQPGTPSPPQQLSEYWIGIDGTPPDDALRAQLELPEGQGLLINQVVEGSPAAKSGLKQYDVLLMCNDAPVAEIPNLAKVIEEKKGTVLALRLVRGGKRIIIEVTPERRPASQTGVTCPSVSKATDEEFVRSVWLDLIGAAADQEEIQRFLGEKHEDKRSRLVNRLLRRSTVTTKSCTACHANDHDDAELLRALQLQSRLVLDDIANMIQLDTLHGQRLLAVPGPVVQLSPQVMSEAILQPLADDVSVSVSRKGKEPARISIRKGDRIWEFTETDDREKIPEEIRAQIPGFASSLASALKIYLSDTNANTLPVVLWNRDTGNALGSFQGVTLYLKDPTAAPAAGQPKAATDSKRATSDAAIERFDKLIESLDSQLGDLRRAMQDLRQSIQTDSNRK